MNARRNISNKPTQASISCKVAQKYFPPFVVLSSRPQVIKKLAKIRGNAAGTIPQLFSIGHTK